ncbi:MAG: hypothetical protein ABIG89_00895 [Candidatus Woesearchaeota archaeon]
MDFNEDGLDYSFRDEDSKLRDIVYDPYMISHKDGRARNVELGDVTDFFDVKESGIEVEPSELRKDPERRRLNDGHHDIGLIRRISEDVDPEVLADTIENSGVYSLDILNERGIHIEPNLGEHHGLYSSPEDQLMADLTVLEIGDSPSSDLALLRSRYDYEQRLSYMALMISTKPESSDAEKLAYGLLTIFLVDDNTTGSGEEDLGINSIINALGRTDAMNILRKNLAERGPKLPERTAAYILKHICDLGDILGEEITEMIAEKVCEAYPNVTPIMKDCYDKPVQIEYTRRVA